MKTTSALLTGRNTAIVFIIFYLFMFISNGVPYIYSDGYGSFHTAQCMVNEQNWVCEEQPEYYVAHRGHGVSYYENQYNTVYAVGSALMNYPGQLLAEKLDGNKNTYNDNFTAAIGHSYEEGTAFLITAMLMSLTSLLLIYKALRNFDISERLTTFSIYIGYFSSFTAYYVFLNSAFNHTTEILGISILLYAISRYSKKQPLFIGLLAGVGIGLATIARPPLLIVGFIYGFYLLLNKNFKSIGLLILGGIPFAIILISYNTISYGSAFAASYSLMWEQHFDFTLFKQFHVLLAPQRGWFVYSPAAMLAVIGLFYKYLKSKKNIVLANLTGSIGIIFTVLLYGSWPYWWGGGSFGQRFLLSFLPFTIYGIARVIQWSRESTLVIRKKPVYQITLYSLIGFTLWSLFLTGLYRITPVAGLRPIEDSIGLMESGNRYTPLDMIEYHAKLVIRADSLSDYLSELKNSFSGGTPYPIIALGYSNIVYRIDTRQPDSFTITFIKQDNGKVELAKEVELVMYSQADEKYTKYIIETDNIEEIGIEFDCEDECILKADNYVSTELHMIEDLTNKSKYTEKNLDKYEYTLFVKNQDNVFIK